MVGSKARILKVLLLAALIGSFAFLYIYGIGTLDVTKDSWIMWGYDEWDIQQRYAGWINYRNSSWQFPLGQADSMGYPLPKGINITFMDSMPGVSILFKALSPFLPATFQYEGIYVFFAFTLQGVAAALLLSLFFDSLLYIELGTVLFAFSPILLERAFRHSSLASHYLVLFALYLYFKNRRTFKFPSVFIILSFFSVTITPYLLAMIMPLALLLCVENGLQQHKIIKPFCFFICNIVAAIAAAYLIGSVGNNYPSARNGYGFYSMNLNAIINPFSCGEYTWSQFLQQRPQLYGQYDGFNYLGIGIMACCLIGFLVLTITTLQNSNGKQQLQNFLKRNIYLLLLCIGLTAFAVSNVVCIDNIELVKIHLPSSILSFCAIFRASSRIFYPVYYLIMLSGIYACKKSIENIFRAIPLLQDCMKIRKTISIFALGCFVVLQIYDLSGVIGEKQVLMQNNINAILKYPDELKELARYRELLITSGENRFELWLAGKNNLITNGIDVNTRAPSFQRTVEYTKEQSALLKNGTIDSSTIYVTNRPEEYELWETLYKGKAHFCVWRKAEEYNYYWPGDMMFMIPK